MIIDILESLKKIITIIYLNLNNISNMKNIGRSTLHHVIFEKEKNIRYIVEINCLQKDLSNKLYKIHNINVVYMYVVIV